MSDDWFDLVVAAKEHGLTMPTLRRWCQPSGPLHSFARKRGRAWEVNAGQLRAYLEARRRAGASRMRFQGFNFLGQQVNPRLKDATGWRFAIGKGTDDPVLFTIWMSTELMQLLKRDGLDPVDVVLRAGEKLAEDKMLKADRLWQVESTIEIGTKDRVQLLAAAGRAPDFLFPSEAPEEVGVPVLYEFTARDFGSWVGDHLTSQATSDFADVIVDWDYADGRRVVRTVRMETPIGGTRTRVVEAALRAYEDRSRRLGRVPGDWVNRVKARLG